MSLQDLTPGHFCPMFHPEAYRLPCPNRCADGSKIPIPLFSRKDAFVMVSSELGACEWFVWDLRRSNLIDRGRLDQVIGEFLAKNPHAEPPALAQHLISHGILTEFQAERLLQGKTQGFVLGPFTLMDALGSGSM